MTPMEVSMTIENVGTTFGIICIVGGLVLIALGAYGMYLQQIAEKNK